MSYPYGVCNMSYENCTQPATVDSYCNSHMHYFSNGTEWMLWADQWCNRCTRDHWERVTPGCGKGCPLILKTFLHERIPEWMHVDNPNYDLPTLVCINFKGYGEGGGEPKPLPVPPGQGRLFDAPTGPKVLKSFELERVMA